MATLKSALVARLLAAAPVAVIAGRKIHWTAIPQGTAPPYVRLQIVSDPRPQHLKGYDGARQTRVQADCFGATAAQADGLARALIDAVAEPAPAEGGGFGRTSAQGPQDLGEDTADGFIHRASVDLLVRHRFS